jgi:hypothetical protein
MRIDLPSQLVIDETVEDLLTKTYTPSLRIENVFKLKRHAGQLYFTAPPRTFQAATKPGTELMLIQAKKAEQLADVRRLRERIVFLETELESHRPYLQLFRLGAGSLFLSVISIVIWLVTGNGIPFHPVFAAGVTPAALGVIVMAFLIRPKSPKQQQ